MAILAALVVAIMPATGHASVHPESGPTHTATSYVHARIRASIGCWFKGVPPYRITTSSGIYAEGKVTSCTVPPPQACKMTVDLLGPEGLLGPVLKSSSTGWVKCAGLTLHTAAFPCSFLSVTQGFTSFVTLQIEWNGQYNSSTNDSSPSYFYCRA
jgi:hypothetical protein